MNIITLKNSFLMAVLTKTGHVLQQSYAVLLGWMFFRLHFHMAPVTAYGHRSMNIHARFEKVGMTVETGILWISKRLGGENSAGCEKNGKKKQ